MEENTEQTQNTTDVDSLYAEAMGEPVEKNIPMEQAPPPETFSIKVEGKEIPATRDQLIKWAEMGYGAPNRIGSLSKELQQHQKQIEALKQYESTYKPVDEFAKQNPEWWKHVMTNWEQRSQFINQNLSQDPNNPLLQKLSSLEQEVQESRKFRENLLNQQKEYSTKMEDEALDNEIKSIREKYSDLDFDGLDQNGSSLEHRVLAHAKQHGIPSFSTAFKDYYHDELILRAQEKAKESVGKEMQKRTKLGLLGESQAPRKGMSSAKNVKSKSYEHLLAEAIDELDKSAAQ